MHRFASALALPLVVALAGCSEPIRCGPFVYDEVLMTCVCPMGTVELDDGTCMPTDAGRRDGDADDGGADAR